MKCQPPQHRPSPAQFASAFWLWGLALPACLLMLASPASAQEEDQEPPPAETQATRTAPDALLPQITAAIQSVMTRDTGALSKALHIGEKLESTAPGGPYNALAPIGDLDGDGV